MLSKHVPVIKGQKAQKGKKICNAKRATEQPFSPYSPLGHFAR
jgi:hypothetical protein